MKQSRTHNCGELRLADVGKQVTIVGWLETTREVGSNFAFLVLRDYYGTCLLYTSPSPRDKRQSRMPSSA